MRERSKIETRREDIILSVLTTIGDGMPHGNKTSDSTADKVMALQALLTEDKNLNYKWQWCCLVAQIEGELAGMDNGEMMRLLDLKRRYGRDRRWRKSLQVIADKMHYSPQRVCGLWKEVIYYTLIKASEKGLIRICESVGGNL